MNNLRADSSSRAGFTLLEIMIAVMIIGALTMIALPTFAQVRENARYSRYLNDLRAYKEAVNRFNLSEGRYPVNEGGEFDPGFADYYAVQTESPLGGTWTVDATNYTFALGTDNPVVDADLLTRIDDTLDDGDLSSGHMVLSGTSFLYIIED